MQKRNKGPKIVWIVIVVWKVISFPFGRYLRTLSSQYNTAELSCHLRNSSDV